MTRYVHHKTRNSTYRVEDIAAFQTSEIDETGAKAATLLDGDPIQTYRGDNGKLYARKPTEFEDGRFTEVSVFPRSLLDRGEAYRLAFEENKTMGEIATILGCTIYDLSPWLFAPLLRHGHPEITKTLAPLIAIADAYDANELDDEARKYWGFIDHTGKYSMANTTPLDQIEIVQGRGGKRLLTLQDCMNARDLVK